MNIKLNQKIIKEMCGIVSFKRGDAFYRANKVVFNKYEPNKCEATVKGTEDFQVIIEKSVNGSISKRCSCPTLSSFQRDCQHIAAVLVSIYDHQSRGANPILLGMQSENSSNQALTEGLFNLFNNQPKRKSRRHRHFETRQVIDAEFKCKLVTIENGRQMFGLEIKIGQDTIQNIREFLEKVKEGKPCFLSPSFTYDSSIHCLEKETDDVIQSLIHLMDDERAYIDGLEGNSDLTIKNNILLIPPPSWTRLLLLLTRAPKLKLEYWGNNYGGFQVSDEMLPIQFELDEAGGKDIQLKMKGFNRIIILDMYQSVLSEGKLIQMKSEEFNRLSDLKQMIDSSGTDRIKITQDQIDYFLENVIPGLKKLGEVHTSKAFSGQFVKESLVAKLYLDRLKYRLLAGLEFHYGNIVINPLDGHKLSAVPMFLRDMEKESTILQLMDEGLFGKTDGGYFLHNEELEYEFLYHVIPKLQSLVQIYATTAVRNRIFRENTRPQIRVKVNKERTNWLEFKFEMDGIPEKQIRDVLQALEEKRKYFRLKNGTLFSLETREFEEIKRFLNSVPVQNEDLESGLNLPIIKGLQLLDSVGDHTAFTLEESFRQFLEKIHNPDRLEFEIPDHLEPILRDYQKNGFKWMKTLASYGFGGILADDMGLGKTLQSITFIVSELPNIRKNKRPVVIICPSSLTYNWLSEFYKFAPELQAVVVDGNKSERLAIQKHITNLDVVITSYTILRKDIKWFEKQAFHTVFFDEAQAFKNPVTQTARAVKKIIADHRFALTGTPVENSQEELWSIFHVVFPELFMGLKEYSNLTRKTIARRIRPFLLRRLKGDVISELPEKIESIESVELHHEQKKIYAAYLAKLRHDTLKHLDKQSKTLGKNRIKILAGLTRLRQICCHPSLFVDGYKGSSAKYEQLMQILEESMLSDRRVLIFSQFTKMLELIGRDLSIKGRSFFYLDGQTPSEKRVEICNRFNAGERDIFLISLKAGGVGLNLTGADTVILYDIWWNPAVERQAADRAHRIGQTNNVQVIKLIASGTIEEKMNELQEKKRHLIEEIIDSEENASYSLNEEDIREILMI